MFSSLITAFGLSLLMDGEVFVVPTDHPNYQRILNALAAKDYGSLKSLIDVKTVVANWLKDYTDLSIVGGQLALNGAAFSDDVSQKVFSMIEAGNGAGPLVNFLRKVRRNPSSTAQKELLLFCVANGFMLHENGNIVAYKSVRDDYTDIHSGKILNAVGSVIRMDRGSVDDKRENTCSHGLHFAAFDYASTWAGLQARHLMIMSVNPEHVVSVPVDYHNQKGRCCEYTVVGQVTNWQPLPKQEVYSDSDFNGDIDRIMSDDDYCRDCGSDAEGYDYCPYCGAAQ